jgi:hypothetical protein
MSVLTTGLFLPSCSILSSAKQISLLSAERSPRMGLALGANYAELALALMKIESYCIHGWPPRFCGYDRVNTCGAEQCHHVAVEVQPLHSN